MSTLAVLVLGWMTLLQPRAPWLDTYPATAAAIASVVEREPPLYAGDDSRTRTAATLVALAWFESTFNPQAVGDHGHSHGLYAIWATDVPDDVEGQTVRALGMIRESFRVCRALPASERLAFYASGPHGCESEAGKRASRHRLGLARRLVAEHGPAM